MGRSWGGGGCYSRSQDVECRAYPGTQLSFGSCRQDAALTLSYLSLDHEPEKFLQDFSQWWRAMGKNEEEPEDGDKELEPDTSETPEPCEKPPKAWTPKSSTSNSPKKEA